jgi:hypothetical protein
LIGPELRYAAALLPEADRGWKLVRDVWLPEY